MRVLTAPGSSLGGARPKANVVDADGQLWIAKFPSCHDDHDMAVWEFVTYELATAAGIDMATSEIHRFDRTPEGRLHFSLTLSYRYT
ncbi:MAG: HipA domain-containing protein [Pseudomonadales bacterium]|nr:HipA domain-containing protein [Pseudomonadales bacterium]